MWSPIQPHNNNVIIKRDELSQKSPSFVKHSRLLLVIKAPEMYIHANGYSHLVSRMILLFSHKKQPQVTVEDVTETFLPRISVPKAGHGALPLGKPSFRDDLPHRE